MAKVTLYNEVMGGLNVYNVEVAPANYCRHRTNIYIERRANYCKSSYKKYICLRNVAKGDLISTAIKNLMQ